MAQNHKLTIVRLANNDSSQFNCADVVKMALMMLDARFVEPDDENGEISVGELFIIDVKGISFRHFLKVARNVGTLRLYFSYVQEAVPFRINQLHILNSSSIFDKMFALMKPIFKKELLDVMHFHSSVDSVYKFISKEFLPEDYGGNLSSMKAIHKNWMQIFESKRNYLMNDDNWKLTE